MASFSSDVYGSTKENAADTTYSPYADYLKKRSAAAQKWEGSATALPAKTSLAEDTAATQAYRSGEYARREKAADQQANLATAEDTRKSTIADRVKEALYNRQQAVKNVATQQSQQERTAAQEAKEAQQQLGQTVSTQDLTAYTNATKRYDAIQNAYSDGIAEYQLLDAARNNALQLSDLERYYTIFTNDIKNEIAAMKASSDVDTKLAAAKIQNKAQGAASIIGGLTKIASSILSI